MKSLSRVRPAWLLVAVLYGCGLYVFYLKYVPLLKTFQLVLLPVLLAVLVLTAVDVRRGILVFVLTFPLVNSLPYFFGIYEHIPHVPTALVLFLFYLWGWLMHRIRSGAKTAAPLAVFKPMLFFSLFLLVSLLITLSRYANFYPLLSDHPYELVANVDGVTTGGATMSALFSCLNYLSGFLFFFTVVETGISRSMARRIVIVLLVSTVIALGFGAYQVLVDISLGNLPSRAAERCINATLKDPMSLGAYLAVIIPLALAAVLAFKKWLRVLPLVVLAGGILLLPSTGSLSGLLGAGAATLVLFFLMSLAVWRSKGLKARAYRKLIFALASLAVVLGSATMLYFIPKSPVSLSKLKARISDFETQKGGDHITGPQTRGTPAGSTATWSAVPTWARRSGLRYSYYWPIAVRMVRDHPLSGVGIGAYIIELSNYAKVHGYPYWYPDSAENYFLQVGSELGIFALLCSFWLFWEILKQMRRTFRAMAGTEGWSYLAVGLSAGILSLLINFIPHTFIGSYEIKYTFWLLVGLTFCLGGSPGTPPSESQMPETRTQKQPWSSPAKTIMAAALGLFAVSLIWSSTHSLSLASRTKLLGLKQDFGFYQLEKTNDGREFRWTREYGGTTIQIEKPILRLSILASHPDIVADPVRVRVYLVKEFFKKKRLLDEITLTRNVWSTFEYNIAKEIGREAILLLRVSRTWNPQKLLGTPDPRNLGCALGKIEFADKSVR